MDCYLRAGEPHETDCVLIVRLRAIEAVDPSLILIGFCYRSRFLLRLNFIAFGFVATVVGIDIHIKRV